jgi:hypothetical protein
MLMVTSPALADTANPASNSEIAIERRETDIKPPRSGQWLAAKTKHSNRLPAKVSLTSH